MTKKVQFTKQVAFATTETMYQQIIKIAQETENTASAWVRKIVRKEIDRVLADNYPISTQPSGPLDFQMPTEKESSTESPTMQDVSPGWRLEDMLDGSEKGKKRNNNTTNGEKA